MDLPDFRQPLLEALDRLQVVIGGVRPDQLDLATPCAEWDVGQLVAHLFLVAERITVVGRGGSALTVTPATVQVGADPAAGFAARVQEARAAWAEDAGLTRTVVVPWGEVPGAIALAGYLPEVVAHCWDLATATGQPSETDARLAGVALSAAERAIPAEREGYPFAAVVPSSPDDSPTTRFVHWMGRATADRPTPVGATSAG